MGYCGISFTIAFFSGLTGSVIVFFFSGFFLSLENIFGSIFWHSNRLWSCDEYLSSLYNFWLEFLNLSEKSLEWEILVCLGALKLSVSYLLFPSWLYYKGKEGYWRDWSWMYDLKSDVWFRKPLSLLNPELILSSSV